MKYFIITFLITLAFLGCDKERSTSKKLAGEWEIVSYQQTDSEGLNEYATCTGSMIFDECSDYSIPCTYSLGIEYIFPSNTGNTIQNGTFQVIEKGGYMDITTLNSSNVVTSTFTYRILTQTNTDLQLEFTDSIKNIHIYLFKKKK